MNKYIQIPNLSLIVAGVGWVLSKFPYEWVHRFGSTTYTVAIIIWAYLEIVSGVSWFRRLLGLVVMLMTAYSLFFQFK